MNKEVKMQMKKFTNEEICGAMIYCRDFDSCNLNCPFQNKEVNCASIISNYALDISNRQKAEIERLQKANEYLAANNKGLRLSLYTLKSEAIKEFAERLLDECLEYPLLDGDLTILVNRRDFDRLVKEVTEEIYNE